VASLNHNSLDQGIPFRFSEGHALANFVMLPREAAG
jgi:hypothetical protein